MNRLTQKFNTYSAVQQKNIKYKPNKGGRPQITKNKKNNTKDNILSSKKENEKNKNKKENKTAYSTINKVKPKINKDKKK